MTGTKTLINAVEVRLSEIDEGIPFTINRLSDLGTRSSIQSILQKLCDRGIIMRVMRGFYTRPKILAFAKNEVSTTSVDLLARAWADDRKYLLVDSGMQSAYRLRFQSQAPMKIIYWTNGPTKVIRIGYSTANIQHVSDFKLQWANETLGGIFRAFLVVSPGAISNKKLKLIFSNCFQSTTETKQAIKSLLCEPRLKNWHPLLNQQLQEFTH